MTIQLEQLLPAHLCIVSRIGAYVASSLTVACI